jgi:two-component system sensor histidine kinase QseC
MNSIRSYLVVTVVAAFALVSFVASLNGYQASMREAEKLLDSQLVYASEILQLTFVERHSPFVEEGASREFAFQVWSKEGLLLASVGMPADPIDGLNLGFHSANFSGYRWRTYSQQGDLGQIYIVAERDDQRHRVAEQVVLASVVPLLLWLPASALLVWLLVGAGLKPLRNLSAQINTKRSDDLDPLGYDDPPRELVQLIDSTNSLLARLSAAFEREKHFASHAAHELRTPLSVLKVHLHNLAVDLPAGHQGLAHANSAIEKMQHLVEQILDLNRTNPEIISASFQQLDLHSLVQRTMAEQWPHFSDKQQSLSLVGEATYMTGDAAMLEILLANLLGNANRYVPEGGEVQVTISSDEPGVQLTVEDSGPGIPAQERSQVFQRFYRLTGATEGSASGTGLGMAIVQHIVLLHKARIDLLDSEFGGLKVVVYFGQEPMT